MTRSTKIVLSMLTMGVLSFVGALIVSWQAKIGFLTTSFFRSAECESGHMPQDSDALLRQATPALAEGARSLWKAEGVHARVTNRAEGRFLEVSGTYVWPFTREEPLDNDCGGHTE